MTTKKLTTKLIYDKDKEYVLMYKIDFTGYIYKNKIYAFYNDNEGENVTSYLKSFIKSKKLIFVNEDLLYKTIDNFNENYKSLKYVTRSNQIYSIKKSLYKGFKFLDKKKTKEEVLNVGTKPNRYVPKKIP